MAVYVAIPGSDAPGALWPARALPLAADGDTGTAVDSATVLVVAADTGTAADSAVVTSVVATGDTGTGVENATVRVQAPDSGSGADTATVTATVPASDTGAGTDTALVDEHGADTATAVDSATVIVVVADTASAVDNAPTPLATVFSSETGAFTDVATILIRDDDGMRVVDTAHKGVVGDIDSLRTYTVEADGEVELAGDDNFRVAAIDLSDIDVPVYV